MKSLSHITIHICMCIHTYTYMTREDKVQEMTFFCEEATERHKQTGNQAWRGLLPGLLRASLCCFIGMQIPAPLSLRSHSALSHWMAFLTLWSLVVFTSCCCQLSVSKILFFMNIILSRSHLTSFSLSIFLFLNLIFHPLCFLCQLLDHQIMAFLSKLETQSGLSGDPGAFSFDIHLGGNGD